MPIEFIILLYLKQKFPNWDPGVLQGKCNKENTEYMLTLWFLFGLLNAGNFKTNQGFFILSFCITYNGNTHTHTHTNTHKRIVMSGHPWHRRFITLVIAGVYANHSLAGRGFVCSSASFDHSCFM